MYTHRFCLFICWFLSLCQRCLFAIFGWLIFTWLSHPCSYLWLWWILLPEAYFGCIGEVLIWCLGWTLSGKAFGNGIRKVNYKLWCAIFPISHHGSGVQKLISWTGTLWGVEDDRNDSHVLRRNIKRFCFWQVLITCFFHHLITWIQILNEKKIDVCFYWVEF